MTHGNVRRHFWWSQLGWGGCSWHVGLETSHTAMHRTPPSTKRYPAPDVNSAKVEKPWGQIHCLVSSETPKFSAVILKVEITLSSDPWCLSLLNITCPRPVASQEIFNNKTGCLTWHPPSSLKVTGSPCLYSKVRFVSSFPVQFLSSQALGIEWLVAFSHHF